MSPRVLRVAALALPLVVLGALVVRAELVVRRGRAYVLSVEGYDPRDLLRGQYVRYRVKWNGVKTPCADADDASCAVCFERGAPEQDPPASAVDLSAVEGCDAFIRRDQLDRLHEYFIPEGRGPALEQALRARHASVRVAVSRAGTVVVEDLLVDGRPWREVVGP